MNKNNNTSNTKEELRDVFIHALARELAEKYATPGADFSKYWKMAERRLNKLIKSRESALLSRVRSELPTSVEGVDAMYLTGFNDCKYFVKVKLDQLSKEMG